MLVKLIIILYIYKYKIKKYNCSVVCFGNFNLVIFERI